MRVFFLTAITVLLFAAGCSSTQSYYIEPEYKQSKIHSSVLVLPIQREWFEGNFIHTFGNLSKEQKSAFYSTLAGLFAEHIRSDIYAIDAYQKFADSLFVSKRFITGDKEFQAMVPRNGAELKLNGQEPRIILVLDQYFYRKKQQLEGGSGYAGHESELKHYLYFETKYVYWDTRKVSALAWGSADASIAVLAGDDIGFQDYLAVLAKTIEKIAERGPVI